MITLTRALLWFSLKIAVSEILSKGWSLKFMCKYFVKLFWLIRKRKEWENSFWSIHTLHQELFGSWIGLASTTLQWRWRSSKGKCKCHSNEMKWKSGSDGVVQPEPTTMAFSWKVWWNFNFGWQRLMWWGELRSFCSNLILSLRLVT